MQAAEKKAPPGLRIQKQGDASAACRRLGMRRSQPCRCTRFQDHGLEDLNGLPYSRKAPPLTAPRTVTSQLLEADLAYPVWRPALSKCFLDRPLTRSLPRGNSLESRTTLPKARAAERLYQPAEKIPTDHTANENLWPVNSNCKCTGECLVKNLSGSLVV